MSSTTTTPGAANHVAIMAKAAGALRALAALAAVVCALPARAFRRRQLMHTMAGMNDHELADIGLSRQDLTDSEALPLTSEMGAFFATRVSERRRRSR